MRHLWTPLLKVSQQRSPPYITVRSKAQQIEFSDSSALHPAYRAFVRLLLQIRKYKECLH